MKFFQFLLQTFFDSMKLYFTFIARVGRLIRFTNQIRQKYTTLILMLYLINILKAKLLVLTQLGLFHIFLNNCFT